MTWALKDKNSKYRSRRAFIQDLRQRSMEPWEQRTAPQKQNYKYYNNGSGWTKLWPHATDDAIKRFKELGIKLR